MKTFLAILVVAALSVLSVAQAQQAAPPGGGSMGPGMMMGMHQQWILLPPLVVWFVRRQLT